MTKKILMCANHRANPNNPSCAARGSLDLIANLERQLQTKDVAIAVEKSPCMGYCNIGPNARLTPGGAFFHEISDKNLNVIIQAAKDFLKH